MASFLNCMACTSDSPVADGDDEMKRYVKAFRICRSQAEIAVEMGVEVSKVYNITKRLKRKLESEKVLWIE